MSPLFAFMGVGSALLAHAENQARHTGYDVFTATVPLASASFLMRFGYEIVPHIAEPGTGSDDVPVFVMRKRDTGPVADADDAAHNPPPPCGR